MMVGLPLRGPHVAVSATGQRFATDDNVAATVAGTFHGAWVCGAATDRKEQTCP